jgi:hypothetical protein
LAGVERPSTTAPEFSAAAYALGINVALDVPEEVTVWFGSTRHVPVCGLLDGTGIRATLVPTGDGKHRLFLNAEMRSACGIAVGDACSVVLWADPSDRTPVLPDDVRAALEEAGVLADFLAWPPSHRREYLVAIEDAKTPATRLRRIARTIETILE